MDKVKILVVEDEWVTAKDIKNSLETLNYAVPATVATGEEAIQKAIELQPDLVLMDIILQGEIDGIEAAEQIHTRCHIPVVFLTAYSDRETLDRANATQPYGYLLKPFEDRELNSTIQIALSRYKATVELRSQLAAIVESSDDAIIGKTWDDIIASWNSGAQKIFGYSAEDAIARSNSILLPSNLADEMLQILDKIRRGEKVEHDETVRRRKDGQHIDVSLTISPIKDATGKVIGVSEIARDITKRKRDEQIIREQQSLLSNLIEGTTDLIAALDLDFRYITFNNAYKAEFLQIFGREIAIGTSMIEAKAVEIWKRALAGEEFTVVRELGDINRKQSYYEITYSSIRRENGQQIGASHIAKDVSDRILAEQALRDSEQRFRNAFDYAAIGMALAALDGRFLRVNRSFCEMTGYGEAEMLATTFQSMTHPDDLDLDLVYARQLLSGEISSYHREKRYIHKQGHIVWVLLSASLVRSDRGQPLYFIAQVQDISDAYQQAMQRKQAEEQIKAALKEKEVLLKEIHHRVKNNLQIVKSLLQMQSRRTKEQEAILVLQDSQNRIASIALVHEKLYRSDDLANIDFAQYIPDLTTHLFDTYNVSSNSVALTIEVDEIFLEIDTAIPCGLIINELVSNSLKYAFPHNRKGEG
jgi:PAS domain S-box-containing protein